MILPNKTDKLFHALVENQDVLTAKQIRYRYNIANPSRHAHYLRECGVDIVSKRFTNSKGVVRQKYLHEATL